MLKTEILLLILHLGLVLMLLPVVVIHIINLNVVGLVSGIIAECCWSYLAIRNIIEIKEIKKSEYHKEEQDG